MKAGFKFCNPHEFWFVKWMWVLVDSVVVVGIEGFVPIGEQQLVAVLGWVLEVSVVL